MVGKKEIRLILSASLALILVNSVFICSSSALVDKPLSEKLDNAWRALERMSDDPGSTRLQWLKLVAALKRIGRDANSAQLKSRSRRLAARALLALYHRSGRSEDLSLAMRQYRESNRCPDAGGSSGGDLRSGAQGPCEPASYSGAGGPGQIESPSQRVQARGPVNPRPRGPLPLQTKMAEPAGGPCMGGPARERSLLKAARPGAKEAAQPRKRAIFKKSRPAPLIVIDPGHGGKDPGAISPNQGLVEKDVTLAIAVRVKRFLEKLRPGVKVKLTRTRDIFLTLEERAAIANSMNADIFLSIHCNASKDNSSRGFETYYLSPARTKSAMALAARENGMTIASLSDLQTTLLDLMVCSKVSESSRLAKSINFNIGKVMKLKNSSRLNRGVRPGPFYVLFGAKAPAALVECGFISNLEEARKMLQKNHLDRVGAGVARGILNFLHPLDHEGVVAMGAKKCFPSHLP